MPLNYSSKQLERQGFSLGRDGLYSRQEKEVGVFNGRKAFVKATKEENLQMMVCNYLRNFYPDVIFTCDLSSGMKLTIGQAVKAKRMRSSRGMPDVMILAKRHGKNGLFIELKRQGTKIYLKDGITLVSDEHIREQAAILETLRNEGYEAQFAIGIDNARQLIDNYLKK